MIKFFKYFSIFFLITFSIKGNSQVTLLPFAFEGRDSLLNCKIIERYEDLVKYINLYVNPSTATEDRYHLNISIFRLLSDDLVSGVKVGIYDKSLENKTNIPYNRSDYIRILNELSNFNYVYQKEFLGTGAPYSTRKQTNIESSISTDFGINYRSPYYHFGMDYLENSVKSDEVSSTIRSSSKVDFKKYLMLKKLRGRFSKMISKKKYEVRGEEYVEKRNAYYQLCKTSYDQRDTIRNEDCLVKFKELSRLEFKLRSLEIKFQVIYESEVDDYREEEKRLKKSLASCNCPVPEPPRDEDGDGYSYIVDLDDNNPNVYPGAPIDCDQWGDDDNCDGVLDLCCEDKDGDGFYSSLDCDCIQNLKSEDILSKCDCDDEDPTVFPGASIDCTNSSSDDNCDGKRDTLQMQIGDEIQLSKMDNFYPPFGLTNFGKDRSFYAYSGLILAGVGSTVYHKVQSNKWSQKYEAAETFRAQDEFYEEANKNHKRFLLSAAFTTGVYLTSLVDLRIRYALYNKIREEIKERNAGCALIYEIELNPIDITLVGIGPSLKLRF
ncbi:putative metal-binding motif-containing protein [Saprospiraceae bacterium]|nr:putative metal-binding motif-containing protein [Saprospiraceae bacterium]